ncbi:MAG: hypothetical protein ABSC92_14180 [Rhizomicrobium sp.]|jgi:hypothetical protein
MSHHFEPPSDEQLMAVYLRSVVAYELASMAADNNDYAVFCTAKAWHDRLIDVFEAMRERQRGATVH